MDDDRLLELVEQNDVLYNKSHPYNHSLERKKEVWVKIAAEMDTPVDEVIKRYRTLRDRFVRYKRVEMLTGSENKYRSPIEDKMEFLTPHVFNRNHSGEKIGWMVKEESKPSMSHGEASSVSSMHDESNTFIEIPYVAPAKSPEPITSTRGVKRKAALSERGQNIDPDEAFCEALQSFKKLCKSREERQENEALHGFGQMIIATIAGMSTAKQTKAMLRVTELVMKIRMEDDD